MSIVEREEAASLISELARHRRRCAELEAQLGFSSELGEQPIVPTDDPWALSLLVAHAHDMLSIHGANGDYLWVSPSSETLFGWRPEALVGKNAYEFFHPEDIDHIAAVHARQDGLDARAVEYRLRCPHGTWRWVETVSCARLNGDGLQQIVAITRDISAQRSLRDSLQRANRELRDFSAMAAHDMKEPLRTVEVLTRWLRDLESEQNPGRREEYVDRIDQASQRMRRLIDNLLTWSEAQQTPLTPLPTPLDECVAAASSALHALFEERDVRVDIGPLPTLEVDRDAISQIFQNLIGNAVRFTPLSRAPEIRIAATQVGQNWNIAVADNGCGFDPMHSEVIFEPFRRVATRSEGAGSGLGLAICARIAKRHGGYLTATATRGAGATITLVLPTRG